MMIKHDIADGFHKLGRIFLAAVTTVVMGWVKVEIPDIAIEELIALALAPLYYISKKGQGYNPAQKQDKNPVTDKDFSD